MTGILVSALAVAVFFTIFGLARPREGCGGECGACGKACDTSTSVHDHDV